MGLISKLFKKKEPKVNITKCQAKHSKAELRRNVAVWERMSLSQQDELVRGMLEEMKYWLIQLVSVAPVDATYDVKDGSWIKITAKKTIFKSTQSGITYKLHLPGNSVEQALLYTSVVDDFSLTGLPACDFTLFDRLQFDVIAVKRTIIEHVKDGRALVDEAHAERTKDADNRKFYLPLVWQRPEGTGPSTEKYIWI